MAEIVLFHHAMGLTPGVLSFADTLRSAGHTVHTPDLYDGSVFDDLDEGLAYMRTVGGGTIMERGAAAAASLPAEVVYAGMSLGVMPAQLLAQTRPGARGAVFLYSAAPPGEFGEWPAGVPLQVHIMENDPFDDLPVARALTDAVPGSSLFVYPGDGHLFADPGSPDYDEAAAALLTERVLAGLPA
jgi:dienelactone hydrolase